MLRRDVHRMQVRAEEVDRQTKIMMGAIGDFVDRRETLVDKAVSLATTRQQNTTPQTIKSLLGKKIEDAKCKVIIVTPIRIAMKIFRSVLMFCHQTNFKHSHFS